MDEILSWRAASEQQQADIIDAAKTRKIAYEIKYPSPQPPDNQNKDSN